MRNRMRFRYWATLAAVLVGSVALARTGSGTAQQDEIRIGEFGSLTGATASFGISTRNGIDLAVEAVNQSGGLMGKKVRIILEDDRGIPQEAQSVAERLIVRDKVVALLGEVASSRS